MVIGPDFTRVPRDDERAEVRRIIETAFDGDEEAEMIEVMRRDGALANELVKPWAGGLKGYLALGRLSAPDDWFFPALLAVSPEAQRGAFAPNQGVRRAYQIGRRLLEELGTIVGAGARGWPKVIICHGPGPLLDRFGFDQQAASSLGSPFKGQWPLGVLASGDAELSASLEFPRAWRPVTPMWLR